MDMIRVKGLPEAEEFQALSFQSLKADADKRGMNEPHLTEEIETEALVCTRGT